MRVIVAGGGIGGLACAQGLLARGIDVVVIERDTDLRATGGYKLHLGPPALAALRELLPAQIIRRLYASAVGTRGFRLNVRDHRARLLATVTDAPGDLSLDVDRVTLRTLLATGPGTDHLRIGRTCTSFSTDNDTVTATLDNGTTLTGDVLVLADGAGSQLAATLAGAPTAQPTGLVGVAGRSLWTDVDPEARSLLGEAPMLAIGPGGAGLFAAAHDPAGNPAARLDPPVPDLPEACVIWGLIAVENALPRPVAGERARSPRAQQPAAAPRSSGRAADAPRVERPGGAGLRDQVVKILRQRRWTPMAQRLVSAADGGSVAAFRLWGSDPANLAPWPASRVTALGDAVHAMPPTGGQGAATALLDAASLVTALARADRGETGVVTAIQDHESRMREHAAPAVRESLQPLGWIRGTAHPLGAGLARAALPAAAAVASAARALSRSRS